jgi:protein O-GlcNAc transferase
MSKILRALSSLFKKKDSTNIEFETSKQYWEDRYKVGGNSGAGSYNRLAKFKAEIINSFVTEKNIETVVEFGCGDGNQLKFFRLKSYTAYDVSNTIIEKCRETFKNDTSTSFFHVSEYQGQTFDLSLSLDVIYHLIEDETFFQYMNNLFHASSNYVIVYSSNTTENEEAAVHVKHRKFTDWVEQNKPNFKLIKHVPNKFPFDKRNPKTTSFADFYIFKKEELK